MRNHLATRLWRHSRAQSLRTGYQQHYLAPCAPSGNSDFAEVLFREGGKRSHVHFVRREQAWRLKKKKQKQKLLRASESGGEAKRRFAPFVLTHGYISPSRCWSACWPDRCSDGT